VIYALDSSSFSTHEIKGKHLLEGWCQTVINSSFKLDDSKYSKITVSVKINSYLYPPLTFDFHGNPDDDSE
jgi:hypothetical protein